MAERSQFQVCIVWEHELRMASKLLKRAYEEGISESEATHRLGPALKACLVALWGIDDDAACVLLGAADLQESIRRAQGKSEGTK